eukprot:gene16312-17956_t
MEGIDGKRKRSANKDEMDLVSRRDGYKECSVCHSRVGLRTKQCPQCQYKFAGKEKNWDGIAQHASTMKDTCIKEKLFDRIDQLATKPGWTGIVFLVHQNSQSAAGESRLLQHSYSTFGPGKRIEEAMKKKSSMS